MRNLSNIIEKRMIFQQFFGGLRFGPGDSRTKTQRWGRFPRLGSNQERFDGVPGCP